MQLKRDHISFLEALNHSKYGTFQAVTYPCGLYSSFHLTLNPLTWRIWWVPNNASRW